ncbi:MULTISPECIES: molecular chaperone [Enterobacterales]|uniref:fimbrial biogenesis chaperone n=1 Tax=Enterobacterales TaxID=91347 RepID=UPI002ED9CB81
MNKLWRNSFLATVLLATGITAEAGVVVGGTRLIYKGNKKEASITLTNPDNIAYLIQSWVDADIKDNTGKSPFVITPPLFRLDEQADNVLRVIMVRNELPKDQESLFWLNVKSIPSVEKQENSLQIAIKTRIKLIYRPIGVAGTLEDAAGKLTWKQQGSSLQLANNSPYYITLYSLEVGGKKIKDTTMVSPKSTVTYPMPMGSTGSNVRWTIINDSGGVSSTYQAKL